MTDTQTDQLGVGGTILGSVFAALVGGVSGVITTFTHHQYLPWGLLGGLIVVGALVAGFRLIFASRIIAGSAALGIFAAMAVLGLPGAGGTVVGSTDLPGIVWLFGPLLIGIVVLAWPRRRATPRPRTKA